MSFAVGLQVLLFVILALITGAIVRHGLKGTQIPYTVALLMLGIGFGLLHRADLFTDNLSVIGSSLSLISEIDAHLFLFLFLPTLIFESAFAMEVHLFRRMFTQIATLAVPGLMLAIWLTAELINVLVPSHWGWTWAICLMFGALISATDPVAVVALLKEVSSRKRLETLIEGESLLNDGTAIVFFSLFYAWVIASASSGSAATLAPPWEVVLQFLIVVLVGLVIGLIVGWLCVLWIDRVFNDPMIEISITIAAAYSVFFIAETFHVSGVVAVVTLAIIFASVGRTRISPEVADFLHHFWEMMAYMANTIIFLLVGILVAIRVPLNDLDAWQALFLLYLGILIIRAFSITVFMPVLKRIGIGINFQKSAVLCWGGLRGAVSLALALTVAASDVLPKELGDRVLFLTAGIVVLTIVINGGTMGALLKLLGLNSLPPAKQATVDKAKNKVNSALHDLLPDMMSNEFLKGADWTSVKQSAQIKALNEVEESNEVSQEELNTAYKRRLLETERKHYWTQFEQGVLGKQATNRLVEAVERALDGEPKIGDREKLFSVWQLPAWLEPFRAYSWSNKLLLKLYFSKLALGYDIARGFIQAQETLESHIDTLAHSPEAAAEVRSAVQANKQLTIERIQDLYTSFPEIIQALQSQSATRLLLNRERAIIKEQLKQAVLDKPEAQRLLDDVEHRMAALQKISIFNKSREQKLKAEISWLKDLKSQTREKISALTEISVYEAGQVICAENQQINKIGVVSRGSITEKFKQTENGHTNKVHISKGPGETIGVLALLANQNAIEYVSETPVEIMWLPSEKLKALMAEDPKLTREMCKLLASYSS